VGHRRFQNVDGSANFFLVLRMDSLVADSGRNTMRPKLVDLFCGIGIGALGFKRAGCDPDRGDFRFSSHTG
jgi:hypothetical protein